MTVHVARGIHLPALLLVATLSLAYTASRLDGQTLVVGPREAVLEIPIAPDSSWVWNRDDTPDHQLEYQFDAAVTVGDTIYSFGLYFFKGAGAADTEGSLDALVQAAQKGVFRRSEGAFSLVPGVVVQPETQLEGRLRLRLLDAEIITVIFGARPDSARITHRIPGRILQVTKVPIEYLGS